MAIETHAPISRRGLLAAALGGTAAAIAGVASRAERAFAAGSDGETVVVGGTYDDVRTTTTLREITGSGPVLRVDGPEDFDGGRSAVTIDPGSVTVRQPGRQGGSTTIGSTVEVKSLTHEGLVARATGLEGTGVAGEGFSTGVRGTGDNVGVMGRGHTGLIGRGVGLGGIGVKASGRRGAEFGGINAQLRLRPSGKATHPARGNPGDFFLDRSRRLWLCRGGRSWTRLA